MSGISELADLTMAGIVQGAGSYTDRSMYTVAAYYRFLALADPATLREELRATFASTDLRGTTLIAPEGINGTMAGTAETIDRLLEFLAERTGLERAEVKFSTTEAQPFRRLKFKLKREIITFRNAVVDPARPGQYVDAQEWNALLADPEVLVLDTRNTYESEIGTFAGAVAPPLATFSDFATYVQEKLDPEKHRKVAMFCTGGIRCEKASAFMLQEGFAEVYHLKGGILRYLEEVPVEASQWQGDCYIFDERVSVGHEDFRD
jgi:UPF0176 protein